MMTNKFPQSLNGITVVLTRSQLQQSEARNLFESLGANVLDLPALVIGPPDDWTPVDKELSALEAFDWIIFSSANGVLAVEERLQRLDKTLANLPNNLKIAAVGRKTAAHLNQLGATTDFVPPDFVAESLIEYFPASTSGMRVLLPRVQSGGRTIFAEAFGKLGMNVVEVAAYESRCPKAIPEETVTAFANGEVNAIAFTSGKTATNTAKLLKIAFGVDWCKKLQGVKIISIGPQTTLSCQKNFDRVDQEADPHDLDGLADACIQATTV